MADRKSTAPASSGSRQSAVPPSVWFDRIDGIVVAGLLALVTVAWCWANGKWTPAAWSEPTAYLEPDKCDVVHALAMMKAAGDGQFVPLAWKNVAELGAPHTGNWNDWPLLEEMQVLLPGLEFLRANGNKGTAVIWGRSAASPFCYLDCPLIP